MYEVVWEFLPAFHREREFEAAYGPGGPWVELFKGASGYIGTELIPPRETGGWYRTIDRWESAADYERFRKAWSVEYEALDETCASLTSDERAVSAGQSSREIT